MEEKYLNSEEILVLNQFVAEVAPSETDPLSTEDTNNNEQTSAFINKNCHHKSETSICDVIKQEDDASWNTYEEETNRLCKISDLIVKDENCTFDIKQEIEEDLIKTEPRDVQLIDSDTESGVEYGCVSCDLRYVSKALLRKHVFTHERFRCSICASKCFLQSSLNSHMKRHNLEDYVRETTKSVSLKCKICDKRFTRRENLIFHVRAHVGHDSFQCNICNKTLDSKSTLVEHIKMHSENFDAAWFEIDERPHACHFCNRKYKNRFSLRGHLSNVHGPKIIRTCEICNKSYMTKKAFFEHNLNVHRKDKKYKCAVCNKAFVARHLVTRHMLKHTGEKNYQCEDCGKFFQMNYTLKLHRKIHLGDKAFECFDCGRKFITKGNLQIHVKTHLRKDFD